MAALKCINGEVCQYFCPSCGSSANEGVTAADERSIGGMLLSTGSGCSLKIRGTVKAGGVGFLCKGEFGECVEQRPMSWEARHDQLGRKRSSHGLKVLLLVVMSLL